MFNNISWQSYWVALALVSTGYYLLISFIYYRGDFRQLLSKKSSPTSNPAVISQNLVSDETKERMLDSCMDEISAFFQKSKRTRVVRKELIFSLQTILKKYPSLKSSGYKDSIGNAIAKQCEQICSIQLNQDEVNYVWLDL